MPLIACYLVHSDRSIEPNQIYTKTANTSKESTHQDNSRRIYPLPSYLKLGWGSHIPSAEVE